MAKTAPKGGSRDPGFRAQKFLKIKKNFVFENFHWVVFKAKGGSYPGLQPQVVSKNSAKFTKSHKVKPILLGNHKVDFFQLVTIILSNHNVFYIEKDFIKFFAGHIAFVFSLFFICIR